MEMTKLKNSIEEYFFRKHIHVIDSSIDDKVKLIIDFDMCEDGKKLFK